MAGYEAPKPAAGRSPASVLTLLYQLEDETRSLRFAKHEVTVKRPILRFLRTGQNCICSARMCYRQGQWWVEDLQSTNGTYLNDEPVSSPLVITSGDQVRCGQVILDIAVGEVE